MARQPSVRRPAGRQGAALPGQGQALRLPVHERRAQPGRYVRPQAGPRPSTTASPTGADVKVGSNGRPIGHLMQSPFEFQKHGQSGLEISSLFPHTAKFADDLCVIRSLYTDTAAHASGCLQMNTGSVLIGKPSLGSWLSYGLGTLNDSLPSFVVMTDPARRADRQRVELDRRLHAGRLPGDAVPQRRASPARPGHARGRQQPHPAQLARPAQELNQEHRKPRPAETELAARIESYELAYRMQTAAAEVVDLDARRARTREMYGLNDKRHRRLRPQVPDHPPAARERRALRAALLRRRPHRGHLGRPQRLHHQPQAARRRNRPADRRPDGRPEADRACGTKRCSSGAASSAARRPAKASASQAATTTGSASRCGWPGPASRAARRSERPTNSASRPSRTVPRLRPARHDPAPDGLRPRAADVLLPGTGPAADGRARQVIQKALA